jgi:hypothetical protein
MPLIACIQNGPAASLLLHVPVDAYFQNYARSRHGTVSHADPMRWLAAIAVAVAVFLHVAFDRFLRFSGALLDAANEFV